VVFKICLECKNKKRPQSLPEDMPLIDERERPEDAVVRAEEQRRLETEIAALPGRQRAALNLCFAEGLSNQEAADIMGVNLKALQSLLMRAKATL
jgi:RNA polymerase sigma-70 factor, ECF subfamily